MTDISPMSGMSLIGVTLMFFSLADKSSFDCPRCRCVLALVSNADMMGDLKSGHLIGARPRTQQLAQFAVAWMGIPVAIAVIWVLWGNGDGFSNNPALSAPQGAALAAIMDSLAAGAAPLDKYVAGAAMGLV